MHNKSKILNGYDSDINPLDQDSISFDPTAGHKIPSRPVENIYRNKRKPKSMFRFNYYNVIKRVIVKGSSILLTNGLC